MLGLPKSVIPRQASAQNDERKGKGGEYMFLYLVQHGEAKTEKEDAARGLTAKGVQDVRKVAAYAQEMNLRISRFFTAVRPGPCRRHKYLLITSNRRRADSKLAAWNRWTIRQLGPSAYQ